MMSEIHNTAHSAKVRESVLTALYTRTFPMVAKFVSKRGGTFEQAKDIFHDALVIWYEKSDGLNQDVGRSDQAYIFGIARHLWYRTFSLENKNVPIENLFEGEYEEIAERVSPVKLLAILESTGRKCLEMLKSFYYDRVSMSELAVEFGFRSEHSATVQKYKCLEKVRETVKEKSLRYEDFLE